MKKILTAIFFFAYFPFFASADTIISSPISSNTTWSSAGGVYVINSGFSIASGTTLTIEPGTIIKSKITGMLGSGILGNLIARGTSELPIYFTSWSDDGVGGDTNGNGSSVGTPGAWQGLYFKQGSAGEFDYVNLSYAGNGGPYAYSYGHLIGIENDGGALNIQHSNIRDNYKNLFDWVIGSYRGGYGIYNKSGTLSVSDSVIDNSATGILIESGTTTVSNTIIKNNEGYGAGYGIYAFGPEPLTLINNTFSNNKRTAYVSASKEFIHGGNISNDKEKGFRISGYARDGSTLHSNDLPIILDDSGIIVKPNEIVTIAPGTIIKLGGMWRGGHISVQGILIARDTGDEKIYFTSLKDDSVGGDTNGDGNATVPGLKDWNAIFLEAGSKADFDNVTLRYSGYNYNGEYLTGVAAAIYQRGAEFSVSNSVFERNWGAAIFQDAGTTTINRSELANQQIGLWFRGGSAAISGSSFHDNGQAVWNQGSDSNPALAINAQNNWWGDSSGPYNTSTSTPTGTGDRISGNVIYIPFLTSWPPIEAPEINPVIIIPGIMGTELYNGDDLIWLDLSQTAADINDYFLTENLNLDNRGISLNNIQSGNTIKKMTALLIFNQNIFEGLQQNLEQNDYQENQNLFFFPYDWRLDLNETKNLLKQKIDEIKEQTGKNKVNVIAHSMGGLLVKDYLSSYGKESIDKLIFVGTPHLGAPKAAKVLLEGDRFSIPWLEEDRIKEIAENSPALHELLPNQTYFNEFQGYFRKYSLFGTNSLINYDETKNFFLNDKNKNPIMFQKAENFYSQNLDNFDFGGTETYNIAGCKTPTQAAYSFGILNDIGQTGYTSGDGTVPMVSADYINIPDTNKFYVKDGNHAELSSANGVRDLILDILNGNINTLENNVSNNSDFCNFKGKKLTWHSPVEIHIYSSEKHTGPIENNAIEYGVSGIDYDIIGHNKFIFLPTDNSQEYLVEAKGLEEGSFDLSISEVENGQNITTQIFNDVPVSITTTASFNVSDLVENNILELKKDGEITQIAASAVLEGDLALDLTPPETQITMTGKKYKEGEFKKEALINLMATDNDSGVLGTWYSINNNDFQKYTGPFIIEEEGLNNLRYYSVDKAGNNEEIKQKEIIIRKLDKYLRKLE